MEVYFIAYLALFCELVHILLYLNLKSEFRQTKNLFKKELMMGEI